MVGIGPGGPAHRTIAAVEAIRRSDLVVGYGPYVESLADVLGDKETYTSPMRQEIKRVRVALEAAQAGRAVALVSSGDAGIYGMAGLAMELVEAENFDVDIEVIAGVSAANAAAAAVGAPLMLDFATISLSDLLVSWEVIARRIDAVASADMVTVLYNPRSKKRQKQLTETLSVYRKYRSDDTPVAIVTAAGTDAQQVTLTTLAAVDETQVNMRSVVIIGNSQTRMMGDRMVTCRGYKL